MLARRLSALVVALTALALAPSASADLADERALAERYAPVVRLVEQDEECEGPGEPTTRSTSSCCSPTSRPSRSAAPGAAPTS